MRVVPLDAQARRKIIELKNIAVANFASSDWLELGALTNQYDLVNGHGRLLRSLNFGDEDYDGCAIQVLTTISEAAEENLADIEKYIISKFHGGGDSVSSVSNNGPRV